MNDSEDNVDREIEESKRFFSRFPPVAHHNNPMVQYSHLGKKYEIVFSSLRSKKVYFWYIRVIALGLSASGVNMT